MTRKEAINLVKQVLPCLNVDEKIREGFKTLIPELRESEDERIRKYLIEELKAAKSVGELKFVIPQPTREECIAYLEKQKEQKPAVEQLDGTFNSYDMAKTFVEGQYYVMEHPERFGLCKPAEWSEDIIQRAIKEVGLTQHQIDWFKTNVFPPKQEWSDEDEHIYNKALDALYYRDCNEKDDVIFALKDLCDLISRKRKRIPLYARWKPSEEQMEAFKGYIEDFQARAEAAVGGWNNFDVMIRLYEQLKKL